MARPGRLLGVRDAVALMVGMVVGIGVFKVPALAALRLDDPLVILGLWGLGALIALVGALCYAELASAHPDAGGEYHFLALAFGPGFAFLFGWARLVVVQTGAIAAVAFVFGDYAQRLVHLGPYGASIYSALAVIGLTTLNIRGTRLSATVQDCLAAILVTAVAAAALAGFIIGPGEASAVSAPGAGPATSAAGIGFAMIFVMLTYGGWNEAAYLYVLGPAAMRASDAIGADYMRALAGAPGALALTVIVLVAALTTLNATLFTGARSAFALGRDTPLLTVLGRWDPGAEGPVNAHLAQAALALALIGLGTATRKGFATMVDYTAPVFWFFLLATGLALFVLRRRGSAPEGAFRVPLFPLTPLLFCASSAYMLHAALSYTGFGALVGVGVVALGLPLWWMIRRREARVRA